MEKVKKFTVTDTSGDAIRLSDRVLMVGDELSKDQLCKAVLLMKAMRLSLIHISEPTRPY